METIRKIAVLMYGWEFPPKISGGLGVACHAIVSELLLQGMNVSLVLPFNIDPDLLPPTLNLITTCNVKNDRQKRRDYFTYELNPYVRGEIVHGMSEFELRADLQKLQTNANSAELRFIIAKLLQVQMPLTGLVNEVIRYAILNGKAALSTAHEVIHAHDWLTVLAALEARSYSNKPIVMHVHALETDRSGLNGDQRIFAIEKLGMSFVDHLIAVSQYTKDNITNYYGIPADKISVVHNGVYLDPERLKIQNKDHRPTKIVSFVGRITQQKGPYFFIETAKKVLTKHPEVQFILAGNGDLLKSMIEHVAELKIGKNVHFTGFLLPHDVKKLYQMSDVYVMPSTSEPFGLSALEAASWGVPTLISRQSGVAEVLNHALIADFWDINDMATKIIAILEHKVLGQEFASHSDEDLLKLTWKKAVDKIIKIYCGLIPVREQ